MSIYSIEHKYKIRKKLFYLTFKNTYLFKKYIISVEGRVLIILEEKKIYILIVFLFSSERAFLLWF